MWFRFRDAEEAEAVQALLEVSKNPVTRATAARLRSWVDGDKENIESGLTEQVIADATEKFAAVQELSIDKDAALSTYEGGAWVMAWAHVATKPKPEGEEAPPPPPEEVPVAAKGKVDHD